MVTNFRQERMIKEKRQKLYGVIFIISIIAVLGRGPIFSFAGRVSHFVGVPIWKIDNSLKDTIAYTTEYYKPRDVLVSDIINLKNKEASMQDSSAIIMALRAENKNLKEVLNRRIDDKVILARVLSRPPLQIYDTFIIDIGEKEGVTIGSTVFASNSYVLGKVSRVYSNSSVVTLSSSPGETHQVMIPDFEKLKDDASSSSKTSIDHSIIFTGIGGGGFKAQIPKHLSIKENTPMILPSIDNEVIGIVTGEALEEAGSLKDVFGSLPFSINSIDYVSVKVKDDI